MEILIPGHRNDSPEPTVSPSFEEMHLQTLIAAALNNWEHFDAHMEDGELKSYIKSRVDAHIRAVKAKEGCRRGSRSTPQLDIWSGYKNFRSSDRPKLHGSQNA